MKKFLLAVSLFILAWISPMTFAGGGIAHMFLAKEVIAKIPDPILHDILKNNFDDYLVGSYYPDSGYVLGNLYGEDSHWDPFIFAFADYIKENYPTPTQNPQLVAFLFGCATHRVSDEIQHRTFYRIMSEKDFNGNYNEAHEHGDTGIDLLALLDKDLWSNEPKTWRVPVKDLVSIYQRMGKPEYTAEQIIRGNELISVAGAGERMVAVPAYPYLKLRMPWTAENYYTWPQGGQLMIEDKIVAYHMNLWQRLNNKSVNKAVVKQLAVSNPSQKNNNNTIFLEFAKMALQTGAMTVTTKNYADGSIEIQKPVINDGQKLKELINELSVDIMK